MFSSPTAAFKKFSPSVNLNIGRCLKEMSYFRPRSTDDKFTSVNAGSREQDFRMDFLKCAMKENVLFLFCV